MSYMKRFLEDVADELGLDVMDPEVLEVAQDRMESGDLPQATVERSPFLATASEAFTQPMLMQSNPERPSKSGEISRLAEEVVNHDSARDC